MACYYVNEVKKCVCCGELTLARVVGAGAVCEDCQAQDDDDDDNYTYND